MDRGVAERALESLVQANGVLNEAYRVLYEAGDTPELHELKRRLASRRPAIGSTAGRSAWMDSRLRMVPTSRRIQ
jgi:hypothetical protein